MNLLIRYLTSLATHSSHARKGVAASEEMRKASRLLRREVGAPSGDHPPEPRGRKTPKMSTVEEQEEIASWPTESRALTMALNL